MISLHVSAQHLPDMKVQGYAVLCEQNDKAIQSAVAYLQKFYAPLATVLAERKFNGGLNASCVIAGAEGNRPVYLIFAGLGEHSKIADERLEHYRRALGNVMRIAEQIKISEFAIQLPDPNWFDTNAFTLAKEAAITLEMASYHFDLYITDESRKLTRDYTVTLCAPALLHDEMKAGIEQGGRIAHAVNQARHWGDLPPVVLTPTRLGEHAKRIAQAHNLKCTVFSEEEAKKMGMGGLEAVAKGSEQEAAFIIMEYIVDKNAPTIALVGKGITFDSGGLSIKPATAMETMKDDMAGAAAVISTMEALAHLKPKVNVIGFAPVTENLISGHATKPGDIIQFYNGKTAEIKNTDAEGRLILADALSYAVKHYKPDFMIDIATLTGSCAYALGPFYAGLMTQHRELADKLMHAGNRSGERLWPLPFHDDYKPAIRCDVADLCNIGNDKYRAGAITAGFFLQNFVGSTPWAHLDVAGTSFNVPDRSYYRPGATGFGVRLFVDLIMNW